MKYIIDSFAKLWLASGIWSSLLSINAHGENPNQLYDLESSSYGKPLLQEPCLAVVEEIDYEPRDGLTRSSGCGGDEDDDNDSWLYCETPGGYFYKVPTESPGWIETMVQGGQLVSGVTELHLPLGTTVNEQLGSLEWTDERAAPGLVQVDQKGDHHRRRLAQVTGTKKILVVRVVATDQGLTFDENTLRNEVFGTTNTNLRTQFDKCSFGQLIFIPTDDRTGNTMKIVGGVVTVSVNHPASAGDRVLRNAVTAKLREDFGVSSPSLLADHVMYCLPSSSMSGIAYAYINSWLSVYRDVWGLYVSAQMHELGHNLNLAHATDFKFLSHSNARNEYDDKTGLMGYSYNHKEFPKMCFNPAKSWQLKWYSTKHGTYTPTCGEVTMKVGSIIDYRNDIVQTVLLQLSQSRLSTDYYMTYNARTLFNRETQEGGNKLVIDAQGGNGVSYAKSTLEARMEVGESLELRDFNGIKDDKVIVSFTKRGGPGSREATVTIAWKPNNTSICATGNPTSAPTSQPTSDPTDAPVGSPSVLPSPSPIGTPSNPSLEPTTEMPSTKPTSSPTVTASASPSVETDNPTVPPTPSPSDIPTERPTMNPTTLSPTLRPTGKPSKVPTQHPSESPTREPSTNPTTNPTPLPTSKPTFSPSRNPTSHPSIAPTPMPSLMMSDRPTLRPTNVPSLVPTIQPSVEPTVMPTTKPTANPTNLPSEMPTANPTNLPSEVPIHDPTSMPTVTDSNVPTENQTVSPTSSPSWNPTLEPTVTPSDNPTASPSEIPTGTPSSHPTEAPTRRPSESPSRFPTPKPSSIPSSKPTINPTLIPSRIPTFGPTTNPTFIPSEEPTPAATMTLSSNPTQVPRRTPTPVSTPACRLWYWFLFPECKGQGII